jgi:hypothetical protein
LVAISWRQQAKSQSPSLFGENALQGGVTVISAHVWRKSGSATFFAAQ